jgi:hypothetical protein
MPLSRLSDQDRSLLLAGSGEYGTLQHLTCGLQRYGLMLKDRDLLLTSSRQEPHLDPEQGSPSDSRSKITLVHGFYAAMGGFAIPSHFIDEQYPIIGQGRLTLSNYGVLWLLRIAPEVFPDIDEDEILDKSKASTLVKTLTCLQAMWFCLQCIVRLTMNTSISLLELNVFGHCICTFIIYANWWNKPLDVSQPTLLNLEDKPELRGLIALLCSYTSRTVPQLPPPFSGHVFFGHEYGIRGGSLNASIADDNNSLDTHHSRRTQTSRLSHNGRDGRSIASQHYSRHYRLTQRIDDFQPRYFDNLNTWFDTTGCPIPDGKYMHLDGCDPRVADNERQIDECAGLPIKRLVELLHLDETDPQM